MSVKQAIERRRDFIRGLLFSAPYLTLFAVFLLYPLLKGLYMSFHDWNAVTPSESTFVGLENYATMFQDPYFWNALFNTFYFTALTVPAVVIVSLGLALGVNRGIKGKWALRTIVFSPYILTVSVVSLIWIEMYGTQYGVINYYLEFFVESAPNWLQSVTFAMPALSLTTVWWTAGFNFVILLAARQGVPERLYEAARLDGANTWHAFRDITLPQMRNGLLFVVIVQVIWSFQVFGQPQIMTGGGPAQSTETLVVYLYQSAFGQRMFGYAAAVGYVLMAMLVAVSVFNYYVIGTNDNE